MLFDTSGGCCWGEVVRTVMEARAMKEQGSTESPVASTLEPRAYLAIELMALSRGHTLEKEGTQ